MGSLKNLTPEHLRCPAGDCPALYELEDGKELLIVGLNATDAEISACKAKVGVNETAIVIDRALLANVTARG